MNDTTKNGIKNGIKNGETYITWKAFISLIVVIIGLVITLLLSRPDVLSKDDIRELFQLNREMRTQELHTIRKEIEFINIRIGSLVQDFNKKCIQPSSYIGKNERN
jgi:hypothetical protein